MRWPRRRAKAPALTADQWLAGIRRVVDGATVHHQHVIEHKPIPKPETASVFINRMDGSTVWRGFIQCGPRYRTRIQVPLGSINPDKFSPGEFIDLEFEWER